MDNIAAMNPAVPKVDSSPVVGPPSELLIDERNMQALDMAEEVEVRTKLRTYTIIVSLYVSYMVS
jgi:hypothetical protein